MTIYKEVSPIYKQIQSYLQSLQLKTKRKRLNITELEEYIRKNNTDYFELGGYQIFYEAICTLEQEDILIPMKSKKTNGRHPILTLDYWLQPKPITSSWDKVKMMKVSDRLDLSFYHRNLEFQTEEEWDNIERIYTFLQATEEKQMVSIEERSFSLFGEEKYLTDEKLFPSGKGLLSRLKLTFEDIYAQKFGEPFVFWLKPNTSLEEIQHVLIVENLSFYHTAISLLAQNKLDYLPEVIIYGEGKKIENSFSFFFKLFPKKTYNFFYVGDIDPEGFNIYARLTHKFEEHTIELATTIYQKMLTHHGKANQYTNQDKNISHFTFFLQQLADKEKEQLLQTLWKQNKRIPQEVLTIETWGETE